MAGAHSSGLKIVVLCLLLGAGHAHAAIFGSSPPQPAAVSDGTILQIQAAFDDQRYLDAGKLLDQALMAYGSDPRLAYWAGELSLARGRYEDALANFQNVVADPKVGALAAEGKGIALAQLGRNDEAITALQAAVARDPAMWRAWNALGAEFDRRHDWADADAAYGHAIANSGGAAIAFNNRGFSRISQSKFDDAILDFVTALQKKPDLTAARNNLRLAMAMKGEYDRAVSGATPTDRAAVLNNAGYAALLRGDYAKAKDLLTQAVKAKGEYYALATANLEMAQNLAKEKPKDAGMPPAIEIARWLIAFLLLAVLVIASVSDVRDRRIPNWTILAVAILFLPWAYVGPDVSLLSSLEAAMIAFLSSFGLYVLRIIGAGDSKLITVAALFVGLAQFVPFLLLVAVAGGVIAIVSLALDPTRALVMFQMRGGNSLGRGVPYGVAIGIATVAITGLSLVRNAAAAVS